MTYSSSHLGISTLVLLLISPKELREEFKSNPRFFFIISLAAIAPDFDLIISEITLFLPNFWIFLSVKTYFAGSHRVWSHSLFFPFVFVILAPLIGRIFTNKANLTRNLQIFAFVWFTHIIFDLTFGPLALFYPLDTRFYDVSFGIKVGLEGNWLIPVTLSGFYVDVKFAPQNIGTNTFFVNWTPEKRISTFGGPELLINVTNFWTHVALFMYYSVEVLVPYVKFEAVNIYSFLNRKRSNTGNYAQKTTFYVVVLMESTWKVFNGVLTVLLRSKNYNKRWVIHGSLLILILISYIGGPYYGGSWDQKESQGETFWVLSDGIKLSSFKTIDVGDSSNFSIKVIHQPGVIEMQVFSISTNQEGRDLFTNQYLELIDKYDRDIIPYESFRSGYINLLNSFVHIEFVRPINNESGAEWEFVSNSDLIIFSGIYSWDISNYFIKNFNFELQWTFSRNHEVSNGIFLMLFFSFILFISVVKSKNVRKNI